MAFSNNFLKDVGKLREFESYLVREFNCKFWKEYGYDRRTESSRGKLIKITDNIYRLRWKGYMVYSGETSKDMPLVGDKFALFSGTNYGNRVIRIYKVHHIYEDHGNFKLERILIFSLYAQVKVNIGFCDRPITEISREITNIPEEVIIKEVDKALTCFHNNICELYNKQKNVVIGSHPMPTHLESMVWSIIKLSVYCGGIIFFIGLCIKQGISICQKYFS